jgi:branched-chain amino acid transport system substrate-binding protein
MPASVRLLVAVAVAALVVTAAAGGSGAQTRTAQAPTVLTVGALLDLSAGWTSLGESSKETLDLAVANANARLAKAGSNLRIALKVIDVAGDAAKSAAAVQELAKDGIHVAVGPEKSSEVAAVRPVADNSGVIVISQGSTASSLSLPNDNVFRLVPDDRSEGAAMVALLRRQHVTAVVPIWREDAGNAGLVLSMRKLFPGPGNRISVGAEYTESNPDFAATVAKASSEVRQLRATGRRVAVYLAGFDEVVQLFHVATKNATLRSVRWYGSDGVALVHTLVSDRTAARFASHTGYPNPTIGLDNAAAARSAGVLKTVRAKLGHAPDALSLGAYDAIGIIAKAADAGGNVTAGELRGAANGYVGLSGKIRLNSADDRAYGSFDFWSVCKKGARAAWLRTYSFLSTGFGKGKIVTRSRCAMLP